MCVCVNQIGIFDFNLVCVVCVRVRVSRGEEETRPKV